MHVCDWLQNEPKKSNAVSSVMGGTPLYPYQRAQRDSDTGSWPAITRRREDRRRDLRFAFINEMLSLAHD